MISQYFKIIKREQDDKKRVFLDNAAGSLVLKTVADAEAKVILDYFPNLFILA